MSELSVDTRAGTEPDGPRVVLIHGALDRGSSFARSRQALPDFRTETYDRRGYASAVHLEPVAGIARHVDDLLTVVGSEPAVLVGHSFGGLIALGAAAEAPALVEAVGVYEPPLAWCEWWPERQTVGPGDEAAEQFLRQVLGSKGWEALPESFKATRRREGAALAADFEAASTEGAVDFADVLSPVAVAHGSHSEPCFVRSAQTIAAAIHQSTLAVIQGAAHGVHLSHPAAFARWIRTVVSLAATSPDR